MRKEKPRLDCLEQITGRYMDVNDSASEDGEENSEHSRKKPVSS